MPAPAVASKLSQVSDRVWFAHSPLVNWTIVTTPRGVVLIDAGYPAQADRVLGDIRTVAAVSDEQELAAVLVTHAHTDHIGGVPGVLAQHPQAAVLAAPVEVAAVRGPEREQITLGKMGRKLLRPKFLAWLRAGISAGGLRPVAIPTARGFTAEELADFGIRAHPAAGHTAGSTAYEILGDNILVTGDAYVTDHLTYRQPNSGAIDPLFSADPAQAKRTAEAFPLDVTVLPGHGPARIAAMAST
ncbi:MBL fold metallo-hydrolase [Curtobacterium sp. MCBD17_040]|uniref:MBL fold metallo-hydrolase n=1 Tax=Curtobacterium sp. MCBD17_040 TaxID=2175674 RepID=UPI0015E8C6D6|nr:MBL fold metallo-hydrolase [Curtobacterium sp. MCBD17_040]WIB65525.1 MBL fold metallo-hydrolase [Curtobacterium sp. MCBD17_040]